MNKGLISKSVLTLALLTVGIGTSLAGSDVDKLIAHSRAAAPVSVSANATVVVNGEVVAEGSNGWTCMPEVMAGDGAAVCIDATWGEMMAALGSKDAYHATSIGLSYMLMGEPAGGGVSNSDPYHPNPTEADDYVETGPHLMLIVPKELLKGMNSDPAKGGPYVMWGDTDYAHLMIPVSKD
jgi:hypothetical protein